MPFPSSHEAMDTADPRIAAQNFHKDFDPKAYYQEYHTEVTEFNKQPLKVLHELYTSYGTSPAGLKVLDYGCGPVVAYEISAALQASEIVMAEYTEGGRKQVQLWVDKEPAALDWSPFFKYVVATLEGKSEQEAVAREDELRTRIKAIVSCDITADPPIQPGYEGPYDVVFSSLAIDSAYSSVAGYETGVAKLAKLVKPGGKLCIHENIGSRPNFYAVGSEMFYSLSLPQEVLTDMLTKLGFQDIRVAQTPHDESIAQDTSNYEGTMVVVATKR